MDHEAVQTINDPVAADFAGSDLRTVVRRYLHATRPKFFPASVLPVIVGTSCGASLAHQLDGLCAFLALLATVFVHAASNVINDVGDDLNGSDASNVSRIYPYTGGSRFIQNGILSRQTMRGLAYALLAAATAIGVILVGLKGPAIVAFGLIGISLGWLYSLPKIQLSGRGLGEIAVALAFGVLPVTGASWLQTGYINLITLLVSIPVSLWVAAILLINEVPDIDADRAAGKLTMPVRIGPAGTRVLYCLLQVGAALMVLLLIAMRPLWWPAALLPTGLALFACFLGGDISAERRAQTRVIEFTLAVHALGCLWLTAWLAFC